MEFQFHPASPRGRVRSFALGERGERAAAALAGLACLAAVSLWVTVPAAVRRQLREQRGDRIADESAAARGERLDLEVRAASLRDRALDGAALVSRIAFLYGVPPARWPRSLNPETGLLAGNDPERIVQGFARQLSGLDRGLALLLEREEGDPELPARTPSRLPLATDLVEPSAVFGPRVSPWTGAEEFFIGLDLAAPAGSAVLAPADGTVAFSGRASSPASLRFWRFGNIVVLWHGPGGATVFGHLGKVDVRRGQRVRRGERLGSVGTTGWAISPQLHYEYWRKGEERLAPTDPRFAILDRRWPGPGFSLERMRATSAPGALEMPPGIAP